MQDRRRVAGSEKGVKAADIIGNTPKQTKVMDLVLHTRILSLRVITAGGSSRCSSEPPFTRGEGSGKLHSARTYDYLLRGTGAAWRLAQAGVRSNRSCSVGGSHEAAAWRLKRSVLLARCAELQWGVKGHHVRQHTKSKIENQKMSHKHTHNHKISLIPPHVTGS